MSAYEWVEQAITNQETVSFDTEYYWEGDCDDPSLYYTVHMFGLHTPSLPVLIWNATRPECPTPEEIAPLLKHLFESVDVVMWNAVVDVRAMHKTFGITYEMYRHIDDGMLAHGVTWSELRHRLDFVNSILGRLNKKKHLGTHDEEYLLGDMVATTDAWSKIKKDLERDQLSKQIYENLQLPLVPHLERAETTGIRLNKKFLSEKAVLFEEEQTKASHVAQAYCGLPINLRSSVQVSNWLFEVEKLKIPGARRSQKTDRYSTNKDNIAILQDMFFLRDPDVEEDMFDRIEHGGHPLVEAKAVFNKVDTLVTNYVTPLLGQERCYPSFGIHVQATGRWSTTNPNLPGLPDHMKPLLVPDDGEVWVGGDWSNAELRIAAAIAGDTVLLDGFAQGWDLHSMHAAQAFGWSDHLGRIRFAKLRGKENDKCEQCTNPTERVHIHIGETWYGALEPGLWKSTAVSHDACWGCWIISGGPPPGWIGEKDPFRRFAKIFAFRLLYGGSTKTAADIPGATLLGLPKTELVGGSQRWVEAHPALNKYWEITGNRAKDYGISRTPMGRLRRLLNPDREARYRAGVNHPIQGTVSDLLNRTLIAILNELPYAGLVYTCHDSFWIRAPRQYVRELQDVVSYEATQPLPIGEGLPIPFEVEEWKYHLKAA